MVIDPKKPRVAAAAAAAEEEGPIGDRRNRAGEGGGDRHGQCVAILHMGELVADARPPAPRATASEGGRY